MTGLLLASMCFSQVPLMDASVGVMTASLSRERVLYSSLTSPDLGLTDDQLGFLNEAKEMGKAVRVNPIHELVRNGVELNPEIYEKHRAQIEEDKASTKAILSVAIDDTLDERQLAWLDTHLFRKIAHRNLVPQMATNQLCFLFRCEMASLSSHEISPCGEYANSTTEKFQFHQRQDTRLKSATKLSFSRHSTSRLRTFACHCDGLEIDRRTDSFGRRDR